MWIVISISEEAERSLVVKLTAEVLSRFVGGQLETQSHDKPFLFIGEIKTIKVIDGILRVKFVWQARGEGFPPIPKRWVRVDPLDFVAILQSYDAEDMDDGRIALNCQTIDELAVLIPRDGVKLDPAKIEGLTPVS